MAFQLKVVAGQKRDHVGYIQPQEGMLTNEGRIDKVNPASVVIGAKRYKVLDRLSVRHAEAFKRGYPFANGCTRLRTRTIRRNGEAISA